MATYNEHWFLATSIFYSLSSTVRGRSIHRRLGYAERFGCIVDCDEGQSELVFNFACEMIESMLGRPARAAFSARVDAIEGRFYLKCSFDKCWMQVSKAI